MLYEKNKTRRTRNLTQKFLINFQKPKRFSQNILTFKEIKQVKHWLRDNGPTPSIEIIEKAKNWKKSLDGMGWTHLCVQKNWIEGAHKLKEHSFCFFEKDWGGFNPLIHVNSPEMVDFLYEMGLSVELSYFQNYPSYQNIENFIHPLLKTTNKETFLALLKHVKSFTNCSISPPSAPYLIDKMTDKKIRRNLIVSNFLTVFFQNAILNPRKRISKIAYVQKNPMTEILPIVLNTLPQGGRHASLNNKGITLEKFLAQILEGSMVQLWDSNLIPGGVHPPHMTYKNLAISVEKIIEILDILRSIGLDYEEPWSGEDLSIQNWGEGLQIFMPKLGHKGKAYWSLLEKEKLQKNLNICYDKSKKNRI